MKYQGVFDKLKAKKYTRSELLRLLINARELASSGDGEAQAVITAINLAVPSDTHIVFMGFCPDADVNNRLDAEWKAKGICTFTFHESERQLDRFNNILPGDLIVLKKIQVYGKTMRLYGHGRVSGIKYDEVNGRYLTMDWSNQGEVIEVPLMGANATVEVRPIEQVMVDMPDIFDKWLNYE